MTAEANVIEFLEKWPPEQEILLECIMVRFERNLRINLRRLRIDASIELVDNYGVN